MRVERPATRVVGIEVLEQTDEGMRLAVTVELTNTNDVALPLVSADYHVQLEGLDGSRFEDEPHRTVPARGTQQVRLTAALPTGGGDLSGAGYAVRGSITYQPPGELREVLTGSYVPLPSTQFSGRGVLP